MKTLTNADKKDLSNKYDIELPVLESVIAVESGGFGFAKNGKLIIQFEPHWFARKAPKAEKTIWHKNKVDVQSKEWEAFNDAFKHDPNAAMESTSIGLMQVMGFHYKLLGFKSVGEMWDFAKISEKNQLDLGLRFIASHSKMHNALKSKDWAIFAYYYNGQQYKKFNYDTRLANAYKKFSKW